MSSENTEQGSAGLASRMPVAVCICHAGNPLNCKLHGAAAASVQETPEEHADRAVAEAGDQACSCGSWSRAKGVVHHVDAPCHPAGRSCASHRQAEERGGIEVEPDPADIREEEQPAVESCGGHDCGRRGCPACEGVALWYRQLAEAEATVAEERRARYGREPDLRPGEPEEDEGSGGVGAMSVAGRHLRMASAVQEVPARAGQLLPEEELFQWRLRALDKALMMTISHEEYSAHEVVTLAHYALTGEPLRYPEGP